MRIKMNIDFSEKDTPTDTGSTEEDINHLRYHVPPHPTTNADDENN